MNKKNYFKGIYYKFVNKDGYSFALIDVDMKEGKIYQLVFNDASFVIEDNESVKINNDLISFSIKQDKLSLFGNIKIKTRNKPKKDVMGILRLLPIECKHNVYSMYGNIDGEINYNGKVISFNGGFNYIEGDEGINFPKRYIWYNALGKDYGITMAIADIPIGRKTIQGSFIIIKSSSLDKEYIFSTLNGLKVIDIDKTHILLEKGKYRFLLVINEYKGRPLLAPIQGSMKTTIHEAVDTKSNVVFYKNKEIIFKKDKTNSSFERVGY